MVNPKNSRDKKEHFSIDMIMGNPLYLGISIGVIVLIIGIIVYFTMFHNKSQGGAGMMELYSDYTPMNLTNTPV
jgi:hypothetical protein